MDDLKKLEEELDLVNRNSFKGKKTINQANDLTEIDAGNGKKTIFKVCKELYIIATKAIDLAKTSLIPLQEQDSQTLENIIKRQLNEVLPNLLKEAISVAVISPVESLQVNPPVEKPLPARHTITLAKSPVNEDDTETNITTHEWTEVYRKDVKNSLKGVRVKDEWVNNGSTVLSFPTENDMKEAERALTEKCKSVKVNSKSVEPKKLDPKLTISDIHLDFDTKEKILEELLEKNTGIKDANVKVVYYDIKEKFAVIQLPIEAREVIRKSGDYIYLGLQRHRVYDRLHVVQCYHCQQFGHMAKSQYCKLKDAPPTCFYCAKAHASKDCEHRINKKTDWIKCSNCCNSKSTTEKNAARTHKAADNLCPFFIREKERVMSRTAGCTEQIKNAYRQRVKDQKIRLGRS